MEIRMFMWKWQHVFQSKVTSFIESVFRTLELQIHSHTFVIGIPVNPNHTDRIFFQKEDCGFVPNDFKDVFSIARNNYDKED